MSNIKNIRQRLNRISDMVLVSDKPTLVWIRKRSDTVWEVTETHVIHGNTKQGGASLRSVKYDVRSVAEFHKLHPEYNGTVLIYGCRSKHSTTQQNNKTMELPYAN